MNDPYTQKGKYERPRDVPETDIQDWQVMLPDGPIRGGYSLTGSFRYLERTGKKLVWTMRNQRAQLMDAELYHPLDKRDELWK